MYICIYISVFGAYQEHPNMQTKRRKRKLFISMAVYKQKGAGGGAFLKQTKQTTKLVINGS